LKREEMITKQLIKGIDMHSKEFQTAIKIMELEGEIKGLKSEKSELKKFKKNEGL
jgi:hypothetical protein